MSQPTWVNSWFYEWSHVIAGFWLLVYIYFRYYMRSLWNALQLTSYMSPLRKILSCTCQSPTLRSKLSLCTSDLSAKAQMISENVEGLILFLKRSRGSCQAVKLYRCYSIYENEIGKLSILETALDFVVAT